MDEEAMEEMRERLAKATKAAAALAESLEPFEGAPLHKLQDWIAKQEGEVKCGQCGAPLPRGNDATICIACGTERVPSSPHAVEFNFKLSFAFLQFLESIHPPSKQVGERQAWKFETPESSSPIIEDRSLTATVEADVHSSSSGGSDPVHLDTQENNMDEQLGESTAKVDEAETAEVDGAETDEFGDFQETDEYGDFQKTDDVDVSLEGAVMETALDAAPASDLDIYYSDVEFVKEREEQVVVNTTNGIPESVSTWDTDWSSYPSVDITPAKLHTEEISINETFGESIKQASPAPLQSADYDLSYFETFGGAQSKEEEVSADADTADFWTSHAEEVSQDADKASDFWTSHAKSRLSNLKKMERFESDTSEFTTFTDNNSDSGDSTADAMPPPKPPLDSLLEVGGSGRENDSMWPLDSCDGVVRRDFSEQVSTIANRVDPFPWPLTTLDATNSNMVRRDSSEQLLTTANGVDPFPWPLDTLDASATNVNLVRRDSSEQLSTTANGVDPFPWPLDTLDASATKDDVITAPMPDGVKSTATGGSMMDPFSWPIEEFDQPTTSLRMVSTEELPKSVDSGAFSNNESSVDPFMWPVDNFAQSTSTFTKSDETIVSTIPQVQEENAMEDDAEDWEDEEFVWSQAQPLEQSQAMSGLEDPFQPLHNLSPLKQDPGTSTLTGEISIEKDIFLLDQSSPRPVNGKLLAPSLGNLADSGVGLDTSLTTNTGQTLVEVDFFHSAHTRSVSFGNLDPKSSSLDPIEDLFRRSVSYGSLQTPSIPQDDLMKVLQTPSVPQSALQVNEPAEDILQFLNLKPVPSTQMAAPKSEQRGISAKPTHTRSVSFGTQELVPDAPGDDMFHFFHTRSHSAGSSENKTLGTDNGNSSSSSKSIFDKEPSMVGTQEEPLSMSAVSDDPFNFFQAAVPKGKTTEVKVESTNEDDDDFFDFKSAETPVAVPAEKGTQMGPEHSFPTSSATNQQNQSPWLSPLSSSLPISTSSKPAINSSSSGIFSLTGESSQLQTSLDDDDFFTTLSRKSPTAGQTAQAGSNGTTFPWPQAEVAQPAYDSEDEFTDFISNEGPSSAPSVHTSQDAAGLERNSSLDVSFFEQTQPLPSERRNIDFFSDLISINFTNT